MQDGRWTRRQVLRTTAAGAGAWALSTLVTGRRASATTPTVTGVDFDDPPFTLGVASGYPTVDSVVLWTRLAPEPLAADGGIVAPVDVTWEVSEDPAFSSVLRSGTVVATSASGHSVHVTVDGLSPASTYYYRFRTAGATSRTGRTRTTPAGSPTSVRIAVASCQQFSSGYYGAHHHIAEEDLDLVVHLGDYVYEGDGGNEDRLFDATTATTLDDFRVRHAVYKGDPRLREAHAAHPWVLTWDDHEVRNNYTDLGETVSAAVRTAAYQAYYEHLPIRLTPSGPPNGPSFRLYQQVAFGDLLDLALLDVRQYRSAGLIPVVTPGTMLGGTQKAWLKTFLSASTAAWRLLGNPVPMRIWNPLFFNTERREILNYIDNHQIADVVSVAGDAHHHAWTHLKLDPVLPASKVIVPEFGITSITSQNRNQDPTLLYALDPSLRYHDDDTHGYVVCEVTTESFRTSAWAIVHSSDPNGDARRDPSPGKRLVTTFEVERGSPRLHHVTGETGNPNSDHGT